MAPRKKKEAAPEAAEQAAPEPPEPVVPEPAPELAAASEPEHDVAIERVVAFFLGGQRYALSIDCVQEIQQIVAFSEVPAGGSVVVGMVNLRGSVIPAVDMRRLVGLEPMEYTLETPMIISHIRGQLVALIVDEVQDVLTMPDGVLQPVPQLHALADRMIGVVRLDNELIYLLDADRLALGASAGTGW